VACERSRAGEDFAVDRLKLRVRTEEAIPAPDTHGDADNFLVGRHGETILHLYLLLGRTRAKGQRGRPCDDDGRRARPYAAPALNPGSGAWVRAAQGMQACGAAARMDLTRDDLRGWWHDGFDMGRLPGKSKRCGVLG